MGLAVILGLLIAALVLGVVLVRGARVATEHEGQIGWAYVVTTAPDGTRLVVSPELDALVRSRHENVEETDPNLERWFRDELAAMQRALDDDA